MKPVLKPYESDASRPATAWLTTFADLTALMLAFFVMIFAMSTMNMEKWEIMVSRLAAPVPQDHPVPPSTVPAQSVETVDISPALPLGYLGRLLQEKLDQDVVLAQAIVTLRDDRIFISLSGEALFGSRGVGLTDEAREALRRLGGVLENIGNRIDIYGHAQPLTRGHGEHEHWRSSLRRAEAVANELKRIGIERNITILGLGQSRYKHLYPGLSAVRRSGLANRVDIVIHPMKEEP